MANFVVQLRYATRSSINVKYTNNTSTGGRAYWSAPYWQLNGSGTKYYGTAGFVGVSGGGGTNTQTHSFGTTMSAITSGYYKVYISGTLTDASGVTDIATDTSTRYFYPYRKLHVAVEGGHGSAVFTSSGTDSLVGNCGVNYYLTVTPDSGYEFDYWYPTDTNSHYGLSEGVTSTWENDNLSAGWCGTAGLTSTSSGLSTNIRNGDSNTPAREVRVVFKQLPVVNYTLTYNGNGNSGGTVPSSVTQASGTSITLSSNTLTKSSTSSYVVSFNGNGGTAGAASATSYISYSHGGWNTNSSGTGTNYSLGGSYTITGNATLYAKWNSTQGAVTTPSATRTGYNFTGWYNGSGSWVVGANASYTPTATTTLYAGWTAIGSTVSFNQQSGSGGTSSVTAYYGNAMPGITKPTRTGYTFQGYYTSTGGGGTKYYNADGSSARAWDKTSATTLYAYWTANTYSVTLNANGGSGGTSSVTATYASAMPSISVPSRSGFTFTGYFIDSTKYYNADGTSARNWDIASTGNVLWAGWTRNQYTVSYNANGGVTTATSQTDYYENSVTLAASSTTTRATKTNATYTVTFNANGHGTAPSPVSTTNTTTYTFSQWALNSTSGTKYNAGAPFTIPASNSTMYAIWNENTSTAPISLPVITDPGEQYILAGWSTNSSSSSGVSGSYVPTSNVTLYAIWAGDYASVTFDGNGGLFKMADGLDGVTSQTIPVLKKTFINLPHEGWKIGIRSKLIGWKSSIDNTNYLPGAKVAINNNATFTAIWYDYFYWTTNEDSDSINIVSGKPITNALASKWNTLKSNLITYVDSNISVGGNVSSGDKIMSSQFYIVANRLGVAMTTYQTGDPIYAIDFINVRDALNAQAILLGGNPGEE